MRGVAAQGEEGFMYCIHREDIWEAPETTKPLLADEQWGSMDSSDCRVEGHFTYKGLYCVSK